MSDQWNFGANGEHCQTAEPVDGWAVCRFENGKYHLVKDERLSSVISLAECTSNNPQSYINDDNNWK